MSKWKDSKKGLTLKVVYAGKGFVTVDFGEDKNYDLDKNDSITLYSRDKDVKVTFEIKDVKVGVDAQISYLQDFELFNIEKEFEGVFCAT